MRNKWVHFYSGVIKIKATGKGLERFINALVRENISIWNMKRHGTEHLTFYTRLEDAKEIRHIIRNFECKITFIKRTGFPFFIKRLLKNGGFLAGSFIFLAVIFLLSNMIWDIDVKGADPATEYKINKVLKEMGVKKGQLQFLVETPETIQQNISNHIEEITWVGVELQGTTYHLQVVEKSEPEKTEKLGPQHLVANKKAVIVDMFVEEGEPMVEINDHVESGEILVSGEIGNDEDKRLVPAKGKIIGEVWYKSQVVLPLESHFQVFNGNEERKHSLKLGDLSIPIFGAGKPEYKSFEKESDTKEFNFLKWKLPISYVKETYRESERITRKYSDKDALEVAKEMARKDLKNKLPEESVIKVEKILHHRKQNGKVYLTMLFHVYEDIVEEQPIVQGESE